MPAYAYQNFKGIIYYPYSKIVNLREGPQTIYYFARDIREGVLEKIPEGYVIVETKRTGMPVLKRLDEDKSTESDIS